jgi:hypothetical protein
MKYTSLDSIVKSVLLQKGYPLHYYMQCLVYSKECLRQLHFDDLKVVNTKKLTLSATNSITLPSDYVDYIKVGVAYGQTVRPLIKNDKINRLNNYDSLGNKIDYGTPDYNNDSTVYYGYVTPLYWRMNTINELGENLGRLYGYGAGVEHDTFKVLPERNEIQFDESLGYSEIILEYISDGSNADAATCVDAYAQDAIDAYIKFQLKANNRNYGIGEVREEERKYYNQRRILRARKDDLTIDDIKRLANRASAASIK